MKKIKAGLVLLFLLASSLTLFVFAPAAEKPQDEIASGYDSIRPDDVYGICKTLSLPEYAGRHTGHEGYTAAAEWAAARFKEWGLKPLSQMEGYLQAYPSPYVIVDKSEMTLFAAGDEGSEEMGLDPGTDFLPLLYSDSGDNTADLVFAGWGISAPELVYDDYHGIDVEGKFILCFRGTPDREDDRFQIYDQHRQRMKTAKEKGALGLFYIYPEPLANPNGDWIEGFTPAIISEKTADRILEERKTTSEELKADLLKYKRPLSFPLRSRIRFRVESRHFPEGTGYNVAGYVEGTDQRLKKECLVIGGHFDHCGQHMGFLYPGANDNASGSAVVMEMAEAFSVLEKKPKRSVIFVLFGGEEMGLQGSTYFAEHVPDAFTKVDAMFNFDMVGEGDGAGCGISEEPAGLKAALEAADETLKILRRSSYIRGVGVRSSDYAAFFAEGVPCISFYSNGPHLSYHQPGDTIYRINPDIMADIARLAFLTACAWADR